MEPRPAEEEPAGVFWVEVLQRGAKCLRERGTLQGLAERAGERLWRDEVVQRGVTPAQNGAAERTAGGVKIPPVLAAELGVSLFSLLFRPSLEKKRDETKEEQKKNPPRSSYLSFFYETPLF